MARHKAFSGGVFGQHKPLEAIAKPWSCFSAQTKEGVWGSLRPRLHVKGVQKFALSPKALGRVSLEHLLDEPMAIPRGAQGAES